MFSSLKNHKNSPYSHDKNHNGIQPALKTLRKQSWLPSNAPRESDYSTYFASLNCRIFCKKFASLIWQKKSLSRANFAYFASLNICKIILNVRSAHYLQINLCTLAMLAHKLGPSLGFFGCLTLFYFGLLWQVGCRYTYYFKNSSVFSLRSSGHRHFFVLRGPRHQ